MSINNDSRLITRDEFDAAMPELTTEDARADAYGFYRGLYRLFGMSFKSFREMIERVMTLEAEKD